MLFFDRPRVFYKSLPHVEIQKRLAAEKVDLEVFPGPGVFDKKIERAFARFKAHKRAFAVISALTGKAVCADEVACVGNVQTKRLYNAGRAFFKLRRHILVFVGREKLSRMS